MFETESSGRRLAQFTEPLFGDRSIADLAMEHLPQHRIAPTPPRPEVPVLGICAQASGTGKTTLLETLLPVLTAYGLRIAVIKQARADFDLDRPGKDSHRLRQAGAAQVLLSSPQRWALMAEVRPDDAPEGDGLPLLQLVQKLDTRGVDLVLVEGYKTAPIPKIEVHRAPLQRPLLAPHDPHIIAVASNVPLSLPIPVLDLNRPGSCIEFILAWLQAGPAAGAKTPFAHRHAEIAERCAA